MEAAFFIDEGLLAARGASLVLDGGAIDDVLLQRAFHANLPGVDGLVVHLKAADHLDYLVDGHAVAEHAADELCVVPELLVELLGETLDGGLVAALVDELEIVALLPVTVVVLDDEAL